MIWPRDYRAIAAWGKHLQSFLYFIKLEQERASSDGAPINAIYKRDGVWVTTDEIVDHELRAKIEGGN